MRYRNPAHTGANRCWPCTGVNLGLVALVAGALAALGQSAVAGLAALAGVLAVGLRGYLVPRTPELARRLPEPVRARFGKTDPVASLPATEALVASGTVDRDLALDATAARRVSERAEALVADPETLEAAALDAVPDAAEASVRRSLGGGENWFVHDADEATVRRWEARPIAALDVAGAEYLADALPDWRGRSDRERRTMLTLLRYGIPACPSCGAAFAESDGPDVTCCGGRSLVGERRCADCGYALVDRNDLPAAVREAET